MAITLQLLLIVYTSHKKLSIIKKHLQDLLNKMYIFFSYWKLKINVIKCETTQLLFRPSILTWFQLNKNVAVRINFKIPITPQFHKYPYHTKAVKLLGLDVDFKLNFSNHLRIQLKKLKKRLCRIKNYFNGI